VREARAGVLLPRFVSAFCVASSRKRQYHQHYSAVFRLVKGKEPASTCPARVATTKIRTPKARERRRARAVERRALEALAARIRSTTLDVYESSLSREGDDSWMPRVHETRGFSGDSDSEPPMPSSLGDVQRERDALLLRIDHLERSAARDTRNAVAGVAERAAEETRVLFQSRFEQAAASLATARETIRVANARVAHLEHTALRRAAEQFEKIQSAVTNAVAEEKRKGDARVRAAVSAAEEAYRAREAASARFERHAEVSSLRSAPEDSNRAFARSLGKPTESHRDGHRARARLARRRRRERRAPTGSRGFPSEGARAVVGIRVYRYVRGCGAGRIRFHVDAIIGSYEYHHRRSDARFRFVSYHSCTDLHEAKLFLEALHRRSRVGRLLHAAREYSSLVPLVIRDIASSPHRLLVSSFRSNPIFALCLPEPAHLWQFTRPDPRQYSHHDGGTPLGSIAWSGKFVRPRPRHCSHMLFPHPSHSGHGSAETSGRRTKGFGFTINGARLFAEDVRRPPSLDESSEAALAMAVKDRPVVSPSKKGGAGMPPETTPRART